MIFYSTAILRAFTETLSPPAFERRAVPRIPEFHWRNQGFLLGEIKLLYRTNPPQNS